MTDVDFETLDTQWSSVARDEVLQITDLARRTLRASTVNVFTGANGKAVLRYTSGAAPNEAGSPPSSSDGTNKGMDSSRLESQITSQTGEPIGALRALDVAQRAWTDEDRQALRTFAGCLADRIVLSRRTGSNDRVARLLEAVPALVFESRSAGSAVKVTSLGGDQSSLPAVRQIFEQAGKGTLDHVHVDDCDAVCADLERSLQDKTAGDLVFRTKGSDKATRWLRVRYAVRHDLDGTIVCSGVASDISPVIAAKYGSEKQAVIDFNHELRTPLQAIIGFTEFLKRETRPDVIAEHVRTIQSAADALLSIANQTLETAGNEADPPQSPTDAVDLRAFAENCLSLTAPLAIAKHLSSSLVIDAAVPSEIVFDRHKVQQAVLNLLNNAVKFTDAGHVELHLSYVADGLRFSVSDTGIGIPAAKRDMLFQRYSRIESADRATSGTGLGLSITKSLVETLGGRIGVDEGNDGGTTFWFVVPVNIEPVDATSSGAAPSGATAAPNESDAAADGAHILLADDLDLNRKLICDMLSLEGYVVDSVADGAAAVKAAGEHSYDLILMDMIMPGMDGMAATRAIRALPAPACEVPIVALTAHSFREQLDSCIQAGMDATLTKPMSLDALTSAVATWTRKRRKAA